MNLHLSFKIVKSSVYDKEYWLNSVKRGAGSQSAEISCFNDNCLEYRNLKIADMGRAWRSWPPTHPNLTLFHTMHNRMESFAK
jgi:hypothetical protein